MLVCTIEQRFEDWDRADCSLRLGEKFPRRANHTLECSLQDHLRQESDGGRPAGARQDLTLVLCRYDQPQRQPPYDLCEAHSKNWHFFNLPTLDSAGQKVCCSLPAEGCRIGSDCGNIDQDSTVKPNQEHSNNFRSSLATKAITGSSRVSSWWWRWGKWWI